MTLLCSKGALLLPQTMLESYWVRAGKLGEQLESIRVTQMRNSLK